MKGKENQGEPSQVESDRKGEENLKGSGGERKGSGVEERGTYNSLDSRV